MEGSVPHASSRKRPPIWRGVCPWDKSASTRQRRTSSQSNRRFFGRRLAARAALPASSARYCPSGPVWRAISRHTTEGLRPIKWAIRVCDKPASTPAMIAARSSTPSIRRHPMISLQTASPLHENCLHPMTLPSSRSSSRMRLCKDSMNPPSQGWPGRMNAWSVSCSPAQRPKAPAMNSGPLSALSAWGAPWARPAKSSISITSAAPMRRSTRKARCWRVNSSITLQTLKTRPFQSESNWKSMAHTCPGALASTRRCRRGAVRGLWALRGRTRSPSVRHKRRNVSRPTTRPSLLVRAQARL